MKDVKIKKAKLLAELKKNRTQHRKIFEEAQKGFRAEVIKQLDERLAEARAGKKIDIHIRLQEPVDQTADYDRAIRMLEMSEDATILLSEADFACYVLDDWAWKRNFLISNSAYSKSATAEVRARGY